MTMGTHMLRVGICTALLVSLILLAIGGPGNLERFIQLDALVYMITTTVISMILVHGKSVLILARTRPEKDERNAIAAVARTGLLFSLGFAGLATIIEIVSLFSNLDDPSKVGPGLARSFLSGFYAIAMSLIIFLPLMRMHRPDAPAAAAGDAAETYFGASVVLFPVIFGLVSIIVVLLLQ